MRFLLSDLLLFLAWPYSSPEWWLWLRACSSA